MQGYSLTPSGLNEVVNILAVTSLLCSQALCQGDDPSRFGLLAVSHTKPGSVLDACLTRHAQQIVHTFAHIAKLITQDNSLDCLRPETILREGFRKAHSRSAPSGVSFAKYGDYGWISHDHEDNRWSRQRCVLILGSDSSQLCKHQMSNNVADSSSQLRDYITYRLLWCLCPRCLRYEECCVDMRETVQGPNLAFCWACLLLAVDRSESESAAGRHHVLLRPTRAS